MDNSQSRIEEFISDRKQEALSAIVREFAESLEKQGYRQVEILEAVADYVDKTNPIASQLMEQVIATYQ